MKEKILNINVKILNNSFSAGRIIGHPLFSGSFFMIIGANFANFIAYIYHLILGRLLGPASYGELVTTISLIGLIMSAFSFFSVVIVKFVSSAQERDIPVVLGWFNRKVIKSSLVLSLLIWLASPFIGSYVHLPKNITILFAPILFFSMINLVYRSFLSGLLKFKETAILSNIEMLGRLLFGLVFIYLNMQVFGAILGMLISVMCGVLLTKYYLRDTGFSNEGLEGFNLKKVMSYALPVFIVSFSFTSLLSADLIMVKHFFSSHDAGIYGSVSTLGKIIFYGVSPIGAVMFPIIAKKRSRKESFVNIFLLSAVLVSGLGFGVLVIYYLFPSLIINILYGSEFLEGSRYIFLMGLYYIFYSLANLMSSFLLSIDLVKPLMVLPFFAVLQVITIYFLHTSFSLVIASSMLAVSLLLAYLGLYFAYAKKRSS